MPGSRGDADGPEGSEWFLPEFIIFFSKIGVGRIDDLYLLLSQGDKLRPQIGQTVRMILHDPLVPGPPDHGEIGSGPDPEEVAAGRLFERDLGRRGIFPPGPAPGFALFPGACAVRAPGLIAGLFFPCSRLLPGLGRLLPLHIGKLPVLFLQTLQIFRKDAELAGKIARGLQFPGQRASAQADELEHALQQHVAGRIVKILVECPGQHVQTPFRLPAALPGTH